MLKAMFDIFEPTEKQLTKDAITMLRLTAVLGLFAMPLATAAIYMPMFLPFKIATAGLAILCVLALVYCCMTRLANRLWVPEKYLDESEVELKRRSGSVTYQIIALVMIIATCIALYMARGTGVDTPAISTRQLALGLGIAFCSLPCIQTGTAAWMIKPLDGENVEPSKTDRRYVYFATIVIVMCFAGGALFGHFVN